MIRLPQNTYKSRTGFLNRGRFSREYYLFLIINTCLTAFTCISSSFLNTFLYRTTSDERVVMLFNVVLAIVQPLAMVASVIVVRRLSAIRSQQISFLIFVAVFLWLIVSNEQAASQAYFIAALLSAANGFYYTAYVLQMIGYTSENSRDAAYGLLGTAAGAVSLVLPLCSGFLISLFPDYTGYRILFCFGLVFAGIGLFASTRLPAIRLPGNDGKVRLMHCARVILKDRLAFKTMLLTTISGIRAGTTSFFLTLLLYTAVQQESLIGINSFLAGLMSIVSSMLYARLVRAHTRGKAMLAALTLLLTATALLFFGLSPWVMIAYTAFNSLLAAFIDNVPVMCYMSMLNALPALQGCGAEVHTIREPFYAVGRVAGILFAMSVPTGNTGAIVVLIGILLTQYIGALLASDVQKHLPA